MGCGVGGLSPIKRLNMSPFFKAVACRLTTRKTLVSIATYVLDRTLNRIDQSAGMISASSHTDDGHGWNLTLLMVHTEVEFNTHFTPAWGCRVQAWSAALLFLFSLEMCTAFLRFLVRDSGNWGSGGVQCDVDQSRCLHFWVGHILFCRLLQRTTGSPDMDFTYCLSNSQVEISPAFWDPFDEKSEDICGY